MNDPSQPAYGCSKIHFNIDSSGHRSSTSAAFLPAHLVRSRNNLHICTPATVQRIQVSSRSGEATAEGIWIESDIEGPARFVRAKREVVLSAGPFGSPKILMLRYAFPFDGVEWCSLFAAELGLQITSRSMGSPFTRTYRALAHI